MDDIMISLMAIMFGASQAGSAAAFGPDMGKAIAALLESLPLLKQNQRSMLWRSILTVPRRD